MKSMKYSENWKPVDEMGNVTMGDFDKSHPIDRTYKFETTLFNVRIRFVKYSALESDMIKIYVNKFLKSFSFLPSFVKYNSSNEELLTIDAAEKKYGISLDVKNTDGVIENADDFTKTVLETNSFKKAEEVVVEPNKLAEVVEKNLEHRAKKEKKVKVAKEKKVKTTPAVKKVKSVKEVKDVVTEKLDVKPIVKEKPLKKEKKKK